MKFQKVIVLPRINHFKQRGQVLLFYALLVPLILMLAGVGADLGWYYLNVSRLQNAADAAVLAGAKDLLEKLQSDTATKAKYAGYRVSIVDKYPAENPYTITDGTKSATDITTEIKNSADEIALKYVQKNLSSDDVGYFFSAAEAAEEDELFYAEDSWARKNKYNEIKMKHPQIYQDGADFYYVVNLEEDIQHFFMPGWFEAMNAPVVAVAKLSKSSSDDGRKIIFDANGGNIVKADDANDTTPSVEINIDKLLKDTSAVYAAIPSKYSSTPIREGYEFFRYWTDNSTGGKIIPYAQKLTQDNVDDFFATYDTDGDGIIILYAQWRKIEKSTPVTLKFDSNGGTFYDNSTTDSKNIKKSSDMEDDETTDPITANKGTPERDGYEFYGWSTDKDADANSLISNYIQNGKQLTKTELANLFGDNTSVTLYAVWKKTASEPDPEEVKPHNNKTLWEQMQYLIAKNVYDSSWDVSKAKYDVAPICDSFLYANDQDVSNGYYYHSEKLDFNDELDYNGKNIAEGNQYFIDFLRMGTLNGGSNAYPYNFVVTYNSAYRVHSLFNVNTAFTVRPEHKGKNDDPLYCRFEGEPYVGDSTPIRQIVININVSNLDDDLRPLFFYYDGPDARKGKSDRIDVLTPEKAQPVILNLNADFKGVLWMPNIPVVINGNGHTFEGFIVAKEFRYLDTEQGSKVKYSIEGEKGEKFTTKQERINGKTVTTTRVTLENYLGTAKENKIRVYTKATSGHIIGDVCSIVATGTNALATYTSYATKATKGFNLSSNSKFRTFTADTDVNFMYVFYGNTKTMDETPFHEYCDLTKDLIPLYKLDDAGNQIRVTKWEDVKLYDSDDFATRNEIPKQLTEDSSIRTVRLTNSSPSPLYDEAGNAIYFCDDYIKLTGTYTVFTLDKVTDGTRDEKEFLLTADTANISADTNVSNTDDWK